MCAAFRALNSSRYLFSTILRVGSFDGLGKFHELDHAFNALFGSQFQKAANFRFEGLMLKTIKHFGFDSHVQSFFLVLGRLSLSASRKRFIEFGLHSVKNKPHSSILSNKLAEFFEITSIDSRRLDIALSAFYTVGKSICAKFFAIFLLMR